MLVFYADIVVVAPAVVNFYKTFIHVFKCLSFVIDVAFSS